MKVIRWGIWLLIVFAVLSFGGVQSWGQAILEIGATSLLLLWGVLAVRRGVVEIRANWLYLPLVGIGIIGLAQYVFGSSVYPYLTKMELLQWGGYAVLLFLALESFRTEEHVRQFIWFLVTLGFLVSLFGIIQHFTFNGKLYWSVVLPVGAAPFGPFVDGDHFAGFVELTTPLALALLLFRSKKREHITILLLFTIVPIGALVLSASRAGILGLIVEILILAFLSRANQIRRAQLLGATAIVLLAGTFMVWLGVSRAIQRFEQLAHQGISQELRLSMYRDTWRIFLDHPWTGTGLGTLVSVYPRYASFYNGKTVDHAHNDFLELLAETGVIGGLCGLSFVLLLFWRGFGNLQLARWDSTRAIVAGPLVACAGILLHSLLDFNLHIPSNVLIFLVLALVACTDVSTREEYARLFRYQRLDVMLGAPKFSDDVREFQI